MMPQERADYLRSLRALMQDAVRKTQHFDRLWNEINDSINDRHDRESKQREGSGQLPLTDLMRAKDKQASLPLGDAFAAGQWWRDKASYLANVIQAEIAMLECGL